MSKPRDEQILGLSFFVGTADQAISQICASGGLVVVPAGPALVTLPHNRAYREALLAADLTITDSAFMVLIWNLTHWPPIKKLSGLKYLRALLEQPAVRQPAASFWVMPSEASARKNIAWLAKSGIQLKDSDSYLAPFYNGHYEDPTLIARLNAQRPKHIFVALGGGVQEPLGHYLKNNLHFPTSIHCIGAAIGFLSGDQVHIPVLADSLGLGWLWRIASEPKRYLPRYWAARKLLGLMLKYGRNLPPFIA